VSTRLLGEEKMRMTSDIKVGQRWQSPEGGKWKVIEVTDEDIHLSGPGPCRGITVVARMKLEAEWILVDGTYLRRVEG